MLSDDDIFASVVGRNAKADESSSESEEEVDAVAQVTNAEVFDAFDAALTLLEAQGNVDTAFFVLVQKWRDTATQKQRNITTQTKVSYYFLSCTKQAFDIHRHR